MDLDPILSSGTTLITPKIRYAVHFSHHRNGHPGYLLVDGLSSGCYGDTMLVISLEDRQIYVRKVEHVQYFDPTRLFQSEDVHNAVYHSKIPKLETWQDHLFESVSDDSSTADSLVLSSSTWTFCNGGTASDLYEDIESDGVFRIPEACLWKFLHNIVDILTHVHRSGIAHSDAHMGNWFLHWPEPDSVLPEVHLGDFGVATKFPTTNYQEFYLPYHGNLDASTRKSPLTLSANDLTELTHWYTMTRRDWTEGLDVVKSFLFLSDPKSSRFPSHGERVDRAACANVGLFGYSATLIAVLSNVQRMTEDYWKQPATLGNFLINLSNRLGKLASDSVGEYLAGPDRNSMTSFRRPLPIQVPATFKDPRELLDFTNNGTIEPPQMNLNLQYQTDASHDMNEVFALYRDGDDLIDDRVMDISHPMMDKDVRLRRREYRVARIQHDIVDPSKFQVLNFVKSVDDCAPLSPDEDPTGDEVARRREGLHPILGIKNEDKKSDIECEEFNPANHLPDGLLEIPQHTRSFSVQQLLHINPQQAGVVDWHGEIPLRIRIPGAAERPLWVRTQILCNDIDVVLELEHGEDEHEADREMRM